MLKYRADLRTLAFVAAFYSTLGMAYALPLPWWAYGPLSVTISLLSFFCAVITHNTVHVPIFSHRLPNGLFQIALTMAYGHPVSSYVPGHNLSHHLHTQTAMDMMRTSKLRFRWNFLNQLFFAWVVGPPILKANLRYAWMMRTRRPAWFRQFCVESLFYLSFLAVGLAIDPVKFLFFIFIPHQFAAWGIMGINFAQHDGCDRESPWNHSRNFVGGVMNWFTFNNGYHGMHHMKPTLHWSLLKEAHERELRPFIHPNLDQKSLFGWAFRSFIYPGERTDFMGKPVVLPPAVPDEDWMTAYEGDQEHLGAMA